VTVLEVIKRSTDYLARNGVDSPRLQIEMMLAHLLRLPRLRLYLDFERKLSDADLESLRGMVRRRAGREPLQHILGTTSFCGLELKVTGDVLIPRPETELLAERAWHFLNGSPAPFRNPGAPVVLDLGTGSGCLAITLAVQCPGAMVHAIDISEAALHVARENAVQHAVVERIQFHIGDGFAALAAGAAFDLLVSNPPYIPTAEIETLQPEVRDYDPRPALDGGADGLEFIRRLAGEGPAWLATGGRLMMEFGDGQDESARKIFGQAGWRILETARDYTGRPRILIACRADS